MSISFFIDQHVAFLRQRGLAETTIYARARALCRLRARFGVPLPELTPEMLAGWRAELAVGDQAIAAYVSHVREFYRWAVEMGLLEVSPAERLPVPRLPRRLPRPIAEDPLMDVLACAPPRIRPWLVLAGWAGLRAKEIALLRRNAVLDTARPPVLLIATDATKGRRERVVPMSTFVLDELRPVLPAAGWVFRRQDGKPGPNAPWLISHLANRHLHACGVPETLHQLRHRFGTGTYRARRDLRVVQELLGHASPSTTAGYAAYDNADAAAVVEALPVPRRLHTVPRVAEKGI